MRKKLASGRICSKDWKTANLGFHSQKTSITVFLRTGVTVLMSWVPGFFVRHMGANLHLKRKPFDRFSVICWKIIFHNFSITHFVFIYVIMKYAGQVNFYLLHWRFIYLYKHSISLTLYADVFPDFEDFQTPFQ